MSPADRTPLDDRIKLGFIMEPIGLCLIVSFMETFPPYVFFGAGLIIWGSFFILRYGRHDRRSAIIIPLLLVGWALGGIWSYARRHQQLRDYGFATRAVVIDEGISNQGEASEQRWIAYRYIADGREYVSRNASDIWSVRDTIWVYYDLTDPHVSEPVPDEDLDAVRHGR